MTLDTNNLQVTIFSNINLVRSSTKEAPQFVFYYAIHSFNTKAAGCQTSNERNYAVSG